SISFTKSPFTPPGPSAPWAPASPLVRMKTISTLSPAWAASSAARTRSACARARALARVPRRSPGASTPLLLLVVVGGTQTEEPAGRLDVEGLRPIGLVAAKRRDRRVQDLVDEGDAQALDRLALLRIEVAHRGERPLELL